MNQEKQDYGWYSKQQYKMFGVKYKYTTHDGKKVWVTQVSTTKEKPQQYPDAKYKGVLYKYEKRYKKQIYFGCCFI